MFIRRVTVPKITDSVIREFEKIAPGFTALIKLPRISDDVQAVKFVSDHLNRTLPGAEYVSSAVVVEVNETGWVVEAKIFGD